MHGPVTITLAFSFLNLIANPLYCSGEILTTLFLPDMAINQSSSDGQQSLRHMRKYALRHLQLPAID